MEKIIYENEFVVIFDIPELKVQILSLNTSMLVGTGLESLGKDEGVLAIPEHALLEAEEHLATDKFTIVSHHHPFEFLTEQNRAAITPIIERRGKLILFGHMHDTKPENVVGVFGAHYREQAGALYSGRKYYNAYSIISIDVENGHYESLFRTYIDKRRQFVEAIDMPNNGLFFSSKASEYFWKSIGKPIDGTVIRKHLSTVCKPLLETEIDGGRYGKIQHDSFVPVPLKKFYIEKSTTEAQRDYESNVTIEEIASAKRHTILYSNPEYGKTTVLYEILYKIVDLGSETDDAIFPLMLNSSDIKKSSSSIISGIRSHTMPLPDGIDLTTMLNSGLCCLLVDDVDFSDSIRVETLTDFINKYPKIRYIFTSPKSSAAPYGARVVPPMSISFDFVEICALRRKEMRQLIQKVNRNGDVEKILDRIQREFEQIHLPFTAANGHMLLSIFQVNTNFEPINRFVLVQQYIDTILRKASAEQPSRMVFDYANKTDLLSFVAAEMAVIDQYLLDYEQLRCIIGTYLDRYGLKTSIDNLLSEFFNSRVFSRKEDNKVCFRFRAILEYFISLRMASNTEFRAWVLDDTRYVSFVREIEFYAGNVRNDISLCELVAARFRKQLDEVFAGDDSPDLGALADLELPSSEGTTPVEHLTSQLEKAPLSREEKDSELEAELPTDVDAKQNVYRPKISDPGQKLTVSLFLLSGVVKNLEVISDADKRRNLKLLWEGWGKFLHTSLRIVADLATHRKIKINDVLYELSAPKSMPDVELARIIALMMPVGISRAISVSLGTEKLERQLTEPLLEDSTDPLIYEFFRVALIADLGFGASPRAIETAFEKFKSSRYLTEALIEKVVELRRMDLISDGHFAAIRTCVADGLVRLKGGTAKEREDEKRKQLKRLDAEGVRLKLKHQRER